MAEENILNNSANKEATTYIDLLDEDKPIAGQKFACISFVSPEKIIRNKETYFFEQFLRQYDLHKSLEKFTQFLDFIALKYHLKLDDLSKDLKDFSDSEKDNLFKTTLDDEYKNYFRC